MNENLNAQAVIPFNIENESQVGNPPLEGSFTFESDGQKYILKGSGENIWFDKDQFYFAWKSIEGDFILQSRIAFPAETGHEHTKIGIMMRESLKPGASHYSAVVHADGLTSLQYRNMQNGQTEEIKSETMMPEIIQLERKGQDIKFSFAGNGEVFKTIELKANNLDAKYFTGIFICSHDSTAMESAIFDNVRLYLPAPADLVPYQDYLGSNIEILDIETGIREIVYTSPASLQAPNWTKDGKSLIFNSEGKIFSLDISTKMVKEISTDFAVNNNNDHVLSFDGKMMGISHHSSEDDGKSMIYILPADGGKPEKITSKGPSYLHGWSPDGEYLTYTGGRDGNYDIYKIHIEEKEEIRLTDAEGLDDGSEYSPNGKYIYFNSARTGTMQIWRMRPDGSEQEQLTFDEYNDWFPHISPDGKTMVFLSYLPEVPADSHPFYKHVYIRKMPVDGGKPKVIARLYGGQGTINVHSWSPDGKKISFVSNSGMDDGR